MGASAAADTHAVFDVRAELLGQCVAEAWAERHLVLDHNMIECGERHTWREMDGYLMAFNGARYHWFCLRHPDLHGWRGFLHIEGRSMATEVHFSLSSMYATMKNGQSLHNHSIMWSQKS